MLIINYDNFILFLKLGVVFLEQGKASQALAYLDKALEFDPEHEQALLNSAILLQELGRAELRKVARERLLKLLRKVFSFTFFIHNVKIFLPIILMMFIFRIPIMKEFILILEC